MHQQQQLKRRSFQRHDFLTVSSFCLLLLGTYSVGVLSQAPECKLVQDPQGQFRYVCGTVSEDQVLPSTPYPINENDNNSSQLPPLVMIGNIPPYSVPLQECQGDCDHDSDCPYGFNCFYRDEYEPVPGCSGIGERAVDYCYRPTSPLELVIIGNGTTSLYFPYGKCQGNCRNDLDCSRGLRCLRRSEYERVPGCTGVGDMEVNYCFDLADTYFPTTSPSSYSTSSIISDTSATIEPTVQPSVTPRIAPSASELPTDVTTTSTTTASPTSSPTNKVSQAPSYLPSDAPSDLPSLQPSDTPSEVPTRFPSAVPSVWPSDSPSILPTDEPTNVPSSVPTGPPSDEPSIVPSGTPSMASSHIPTLLPSDAPSIVPSGAPSMVPSYDPTGLPSDTPSLMPSGSPSIVPSHFPTEIPSDKPSIVPSKVPSTRPSNIPSSIPSSTQSSEISSVRPTVSPTLPPTKSTVAPSDAPSIIPSYEPSDAPSLLPSDTPSLFPSDAPSIIPSYSPSHRPSQVPTSYKLNATDVGQENIFQYVTPGGLATNPLDVCQGDCDDDVNCGFGLACFHRVDNEPVPGCSGTPIQAVDYCYAPPSGTLILQHMGGFRALGKCQGLCRRNLDCKHGLVCMIRQAYEPVPGCLGRGSSGANYCYDPNDAMYTTNPVPSTASEFTSIPSHLEAASITSLPTKVSATISPTSLTSSPSQVPPWGLPASLTGSPSQAPPSSLTDSPTDQLPSSSGQLEYLGDVTTRNSLQQCQGDCDSDWDCAFGLICFIRYSKERVPGCIGVGAPGVDYCIKPQPGHLVIVGSGSPRSFSECEGNCRTSLDCNRGLRCMRRNGFEQVPGCRGLGAFATNYCYDPSFERSGASITPTMYTSESPTMTPSATPSSLPSGVPSHVPSAFPSTLPSSEPSDSPSSVPSQSAAPSIKQLMELEVVDFGSLFALGPCQGNCRTSLDCKRGLRCNHGNIFGSIPGCRGTGVSGTNYCYNPSAENVINRPTNSPSESSVDETTAPSASIATFDPSQSPVTPNLVPAEESAPSNFPSQIPMPSGSETFPTLPPTAAITSTPTVTDHFPSLIPPSASPISLPEVASGAPSFIANLPSGSASASRAPSKAPTFQHELITSSNGELFTLGPCQGNCRTIFDCKLGLHCFARKGYEPVPGCTGSGVYGTSYCYNTSHALLQSFSLSPSSLPSSAPSNLPSQSPVSIQEQLTVIENSPLFTLKTCQGNCRTIFDCKVGLHCLSRKGFEKVPGCSGLGEFGINYCYNVSAVDNSLPPVQSSLSSAPSPSHIHENDIPSSISSPMQELTVIGTGTLLYASQCQGNCRTDLDCRFGLRCLIRNDDETVPGCKGPGIAGINYCYNPKDADPQLVPSDAPSQTPSLSDFNHLIVVTTGQFLTANRCEGNCRNNLDCRFGLRCFKRTENESIPGCLGQAEAGISYCYDPKDIVSNEGPASQSPLSQPSDSPSLVPSDSPSLQPSDSPSLQPSDSPSLQPSDIPSIEPSLSPNSVAEETPSLSPPIQASLTPSSVLSSVPSSTPSLSPLSPPSAKPSDPPSNKPTDVAPTASPTTGPTLPPSVQPSSTPTVAPTMKCNMPTASRQVALATEILRVSPTESLDDNGSPQWAAYNWILQGDLAYLCPDSDNLMQRYVLALLYFETSGGNWSSCSASKTNSTCDEDAFLSESNECEWGGVVCNPAKQVTAIHLGGNNLSGRIPSEIGNLTMLQEIDMDDNLLSGKLPTTIGQLKFLEILDLDNNTLSGSLPTELFRVSGLRVIDIDTNKFTGQIPSQIAQLAHLYFVQFDFNPLTGSIPSQLGKLSELEYLTLLQTNITAPIPSSLCGKNITLYANCDICKIDGCCTACLKL